MPFLLVRGDVVGRERLQRGRQHRNRVGFFRRAVGRPSVLDRALDHPHRGGAAAAATVDVSRLIALVGYSRQEFVGDFRIGHGAVERQMHVFDSRRLDGGFFFAHALLGGKPDADDRRESLLLQVRDAGRVGGAAARKHGVNLVEVLNALDVDFLDLRENRDCESRDGKRRGQPVANHGGSPSAEILLRLVVGPTYCSSTVTVAGLTNRTVTGVPAGSVAGLRPPATTAAVPAPAPADAPIAAPFAPPKMPPRIAPPIAPPPIFAALSPVGLSPSRKMVSVSTGTRVPSASTTDVKRMPSRALSRTLPPRSTIVTSPCAFAPAGIATRSPTRTSRVTRATTSSSTRARSLVSDASICRPS